MHKPSYEHYRLKAQEALENYDFGANVVVEAINGWESTSKMDEMTCTIFIKYDDMEFEEDTLKASFTVEFDKSGNVVAVNCTCNGEAVGVWQQYQT